jgi:RNA polymerase sigma-70 factor, ECF subfamily
VTIHRSRHPSSLLLITSSSPCRQTAAYPLPLVTQEDPEAELLAAQALAANDRSKALTVLMRAYGSAIRGYCRSLLKDPAEADDASQTVFVAAFESLHSHHAKSKFIGWLFGIARHRCLDMLKRARRADAGKRRISVEAADSGMAGADDGIVPAVNPSFLEECLGELSADLRMAVVLKCRDGFSYRYIADLLGGERAGVLAGSLQKQVTLKLRLLRRCIERKEAVHEVARP